MAQVAQYLRDGPGEGLLQRTVLLVMDLAGGDKVRLKVPTDTAWLDLAGRAAPAVDPSLPAPDVRDPSPSRAGGPGRAGAVASAASRRGGLSGALERLLADADQDGSVESLRQQAQGARDGTGVSATLLTGPGYETGRFRLLIQRLRVVIHPTLLANVETVQVLGGLRREAGVRRPGASLRDQVRIERIDEADPRADVAWPGRGQPHHRPPGVRGGRASSSPTSST
ncbi:MAG: hypothetical protein R3F43_04845 [bacterium]